jgi:hypothetical protein
MQAAVANKNQQPDAKFEQNSLVPSPSGGLSGGLSGNIGSNAAAAADGAAAPSGNGNKSNSGGKHTCTREEGQRAVSAAAVAVAEAAAVEESAEAESARLLLSASLPASLGRLPMPVCCWCCFLWGGRGRTWMPVLKYFSLRFDFCVFLLAIKTNHRSSTLKVVGAAVSTDCDVQILRSVGPWSLGCPTETSIQV